MLPRWLVGSWHCWHRNGERSLEQIRGSRAVRVVADRAVLLHRLVRAHERPALLHVARVAGVVDVVAHHHARAHRAVRGCGSRSTRPCLRGSGWRDGRLICARMSLWQAKHTSGWVSLSRTWSWAAWSLWQDEQATSLRSWVLPCQWMRVLPWWQVEANLVLLRRRHLAEAARHRIGGALEVLGRVAMAHGAADADRRAGVGLGAVLAGPHDDGRWRGRSAQTVPSRISSADWAPALPE